MKQLGLLLLANLCDCQLTDYKVLQMASEFSKHGRYPEAESVLRSYLQAHRDDFKYLEELGFVLSQQGKTKEAIAEYQKALREFPNHSGAAGLWCNLGLALEHDKQHLEALAAYKKSIAIDPKLVPAHIDLGNYYRFVDRDYDKAADEIKIALQLNPKDPLAHGGLAAVYADHGDLKKAEQAFRDTLKLAPGNIAAKTELAYVLSRQTRFLEAKDIFKDVIKKHPQFYRAHEGLARVYEGLHELEKAEQQAKITVALRKDEGTLEVMASIYEDEGDKKDAHTYWKKVLQANPKDKMAQQHLFHQSLHDTAGDNSTSAWNFNASQPSWVTILLVGAALAGAYIIFTFMRGKPKEPYPLNDPWDRPRATRAGYEDDCQGGLLSDF